MTKIILFLITFLSSLVYSQNEFITVWKPANAQSKTVANVPAQSTTQQIWFPGRGSNFNVYWEEIGFPSHNGTMNGISSSQHFLVDFGTPYHPDPALATYRIKISNGNGNFDAVRFYNEYFVSPNLGTPILMNLLGDTDKLLEVQQWGNINWLSMETAFTDCSNLDVTATDIPILGNVTNAALMFHNCTSLLGNPTFNQWNTSTITNMSHLFSNAGNFNQPLNNWNTANVTDMTWMFHYLSSFNQPLSSWNVSNVTTMLHMFHLCTSFNQDLSSWNVSNVTEFRDFLSGATSFNQSLETWNLASVVQANSMLTNTALTCNNWDKTLHGWRTTPTTANNVNLGNVAPLQYKDPLAIAARDYLINVKGWTITGDVLGNECESTLSVSEANHNNFISIYPVPVSDFLRIQSPEKIIRVTITDFSGRIMYREKDDIKMIPVSHFKAGSYMISIDTAKGTLIRKFIKK